MTIPDEYSRVSPDSVLPGDEIYVVSGPGAEPMLATVELVDGVRVATGDTATFDLDTPTEGLEVYGLRAPAEPVTTTDVYNDETREVETWADTELISTRPYDESENANADAHAAVATAETNREALIEQARAAYLANKDFLALTTVTTAQAVAQVKALTRQTNALIRLAANMLEGTD